MPRKCNTVRPRDSRGRFIRSVPRTFQVKLGIAVTDMIGTYWDDLFEEEVPQLDTNMLVESYTYDVSVADQKSVALAHINALSALCESYKQLSGGDSLLAAFHAYTLPRE